MVKSFSLVNALGLAIGMTLIGCGGAPSMPSTPSAPSAPDPSAATADKDGDGIPDAVDKCPDKKEDGLAPDPKDGCPKS